MTTWTVVLFDGRTTQLDADEITTRADGSLWALRSAAPPPDKLAVVAIFSRDVWSSCVPADAEIVWQERPPPSEVDWRERFAR
jgi:hypothetical protein